MVVVTTRTSKVLIPDSNANMHTRMLFLNLFARLGSGTVAEWHSRLTYN